MNDSKEYVIKRNVLMEQTFVVQGAKSKKEALEFFLSHVGTEEHAGNPLMVCELQCIREFAPKSIKPI